jgi:signal transduction histidine kinase
VRIAYFMPALALAREDVPLLATMALTIFLLTPLFYFLIRREVRPIHTANEEIADLISQGDLNTCKVEATGEFREFIGQFNQFVAIAKDRVEKLERDKGELLTSQKLLSYRKLRVEAVLKAMPEAIIILGEDGRVSYANEKVTELMGVEPGLIMNKLPSEWCAIEDVLKFLSRFESPETSNYFSDTIRIADPKLAQKKLSLKAYPLFAPQSPETIFGRLIILRDATKESMAEDSRANFVAHVAHELKSPLNTLALYSEALQGDQGMDPNFRVEAYNVIHDETERLAALIDNLLNITKIEMGSLKIEKQRVRLRDLLADSFKHVSHSGRGKNIEFKLDLPAELSPVAVDKDLLRIAVNNLLVNAVKYSKPGGTVSLSAEETDEAIRVRVADTGIGIAPEDQAKIFQKFYRAQNEAMKGIGGHGLGLPLAKEIIELHRGHLSVESKPGEGAVFTIDLWKDGGLLQQAI